LDLAAGEYIWIAESDDWADERFLEVLLPNILQSENIGFVYCQSFQIQDNKAIAPMNSYTQDLHLTKWDNNFIENGTELIDYLIHKNFIPNVSAILFRKKCLFEFPNQIYNVKLVGDKTIYAKILKNNRLSFVSTPLNYYRFHDLSVRSNIDKFTTLNENFIFLKFISENFPNKTPQIYHKINSLKTFQYLVNKDNKKKRILLKKIKQIDRSIYFSIIKRIFKHYTLFKLGNFIERVGRRIKRMAQ